MKQYSLLSYYFYYFYKSNNSKEDDDEKRSAQFLRRDLLLKNKLGIFKNVAHCLIITIKW